VPNHWTYQEKAPEGDLYQGDIILRTEPLLKVLGSVHGYFCDEKYLAFIIISQTCDLVLRNNECKAKYINLAVIRSLESMMPAVLNDSCKTPIPGVYYEDGRAEIKELIERVVNQNEQSLGLFYLEPDGDLKLAVGSAALLRVSIALRAEHYEIIKEARIGRLESPFRNKLGWLAGNLYSRVDTPDWPEKIGKKDADRKVAQIFKDLDEAGENVWVQRPLLDLALSKDETVKTLPKDKIVAAIQTYAPRPPYLEALARVRELAPPLLNLVVLPDLKAAAEQLKTNRAYSRLTADAIVVAIRSVVGAIKLFDLAMRLAEEDRLRDGASASMTALVNDFMRVKGPKNYDRFLDMYLQRPLLDAAMGGVVSEHAAAIGIEADSITAILTMLQGLTPSDALRDCMLLVMQAAAARNFAVRLASSLNNDAAFRGAFVGP
jgi:hypothetical protein